MKISDQQLREVKIQHLTGHLSSRMQRLCRDVLSRLPPNWDEYISMGFEESIERPTPSSDSIGFACATRDEEAESVPCELLPEGEADKIYTVILYLPHLEPLSDKAVRYIIAHELGHVASGLRTGSITAGRVPLTQIAPGQYESAPSKDRHEDTADLLAIEWGFSEELQQFLMETAS